MFSVWYLVFSFQNLSAIESTKHKTRNSFFGGYSEEVTPVPIPNTAVKLFSADGTAWATVWESRTPPDFFLNPKSAMVSGFLGFAVGYVCKDFTGG